MRFRLAAAIVLLASLLALARQAHASCAIDDAYLSNTAIPAGCPLTLYIPDGSRPPPKVFVTRNGMRTEVTGEATVERVTVPVLSEDNCPSGGSYAHYPMQRQTIELTGVAAGDVLELEGVTPREQATIVDAASSCPIAYAPSLTCPDETPDECDEDGLGTDPAFCSAGGTPGFLVLIGLALALTTMSRRRHGAGSYRA